MHRTDIRMYGDAPTHARFEIIITSYGHTWKKVLKNLFSIRYGDINERMQIFTSIFILEFIDDTVDIG